MAKIRVIDFETSGMEPPDAEVCEVGWCDLAQGEGGWVVEKAASYLCGVKAMPPEVRAVHHLSMADLVGQAAYGPATMWERGRIDGITVTAAHNLEFEAKFWGDPATPLLCTYKAALRVWPQAPSHSNGALRYWLEEQGLICPVHDLTMPPHRAAPDAYVTAHILKALLVEATGQQMVAWTKEPRLLPTCPLGKFRGKPWPEVETGFLNWMLAQPTMEADLKWNANRELDRRRDVI